MEDEVRNMTNGDLLAEMMRLVDNEKEVSEISDKALARITLVTEIQLFKRLDDVLNRVMALEEQVKGLCAFRDEQTRHKKEVDEKKYKEDSELKAFKRGAYLAIALVALDIVLHLLRIV
jgi:hypothetical protein